MKQEDYTKMHEDLREELQAFVNEIVTAYLGGYWKAELYSGYNFVRIDVRYKENRNNSFEIIFNKDKGYQVCLKYMYLGVMKMQDKNADPVQFYIGFGKFLNLEGTHKILSDKFETYVKQNNEILEKIINGKTDES